MMGANERLEDIAFYQSKVRDYSDDQLTVLGSNYGKRLLAPRANVNQVQGVIERLRGVEDADHPGSSARRASAVIWQAEDAGQAMWPGPLGVRRANQLVARILPVAE
jgi:hypothetical protein